MTESIFVIRSSVYEVFAGKIASTLRNAAFISYHTHYIFFKMSPSKRDKLIDNGYTIIRFLTVFVSKYDSYVEALISDMKTTNGSAVNGAVDDDFRRKSSIHGRDHNMIFLEEDLALAVHWMVKVTNFSFEGRRRFSAV